MLHIRNVLGAGLAGTAIEAGQKRVGMNFIYYLSFTEHKTFI